MENENTKEPAQIEEAPHEHKPAQPKESKAKNNNYLIPLLVLLLGAALSFLPIFMLKGQQVEDVYESTEVDKNIEIPQQLSAIKNSSFFDWSATVKGKVLSKSANGMVLEPYSEIFLPNGERKLEKIPNAQNSTIIVDPSSSKFAVFTDFEHPVPKYIPFSEINAGDFLSGNVKISYVNENINLTATFLTKTTK